MLSCSADFTEYAEAGIPAAVKNEIAIVLLIESIAHRGADFIVNETSKLAFETKESIITPCNCQFRTT